ncbi:helix-turn-helix domain-containing protein [Enterococcus saccharolyticus]|uniref:Mga helix-turn-helix domain-containing protein n=1 Tax=Candidatus Enterococcus willemsii TaxID=1857215 RepID=A0ABQ6Z249_9ENTE|nr:MULTISPECIES: helix-turn-helix domain-containing protein [Enterococcus]KAF1305688.1 hypothetical protein BAU17_00105 [Enterococcus sp. CU12B]MCD5001169.1 helix-turn-helix domain-containing protein [Enterococcus saccharolyticus]
MMYGISSTAWLKQSILFALEEETQFISSRELTYIVGDYSQSTIKKICREIQEEVEATYPSNMATLIIDQRNGIKLIRQPYVNYQKLLSSIFSEELGYELLQQLLLNRHISTIDFCNNHYISESQLRRKIKDINASLIKHDISISLSTHITIVGEEYKLRAFFFVFLFAIHRQFSHIEWIENKEDFFTTAEQIAQYLAIDTDTRTVEILAIWCFIITTAIKNNWLLIFNDYEKQMLTSFSLPKPPVFLTEWKKADWDFLVIAIYASDIIDFNLQVNLNQLQEVTQSDDATIWIELFEAYFLPLTDIQQEFVHKKFVKQLLSHHFFEPDENMLNNFTQKYAEELKVLYPILFAKYEDLWIEFLQKVSEPAYKYFQIESLLLCFYLVPTEVYYPQIKLFLRSDLTFLNTKHLEFRITSHFCKQYALKFTDDIHHADLILSTVSLEGMNKYISKLNNLVPVILINSKISENDFAKIEDELITITQTLLER